MQKKLFSGNLYIFHAFDVGDDVDLAKIEAQQVLRTVPLSLPKYFRQYQAPLAVELSENVRIATLHSSKINEFGAISLTYKVPFHQSLEELRGLVAAIGTEYQERSLIDAQYIYKRIEPFVVKANFFHMRTSYTVIQPDFDPAIDHKVLQENWGGTIAELVRFETESLAEYQKQDILDAAVGYYRGDFIIVDSEAAFVYDEDYIEFLELFEFGNIQHLELMYFDQVLARRLNQIYERRGAFVPTQQYLPFMGLPRNPVAELGRLKVDISVITEQLQSSIKIANDPFLLEVYSLLSDRLDLKGWKRAIDTKLDIITGINAVYYHRIETVRAEILEVLIVILIIIEIILGVFK